MIDVDDNKYSDYWMGHWSLILGHGPKDVKESLKKQIEDGADFVEIAKEHSTCPSGRKGGDLDPLMQLRMING